MSTQLQVSPLTTAAPVMSAAQQLGRPIGRRWECGLELTNDPRAVGIARRTLRTAAEGYGLGRETAETVELLTSELVSNAVEHTGSAVYVQARSGAGVLRVSVWDGKPELPAPRAVTAQDAHGRGLRLVERLSRAWGCYRLGGSAPWETAVGKVVWFELDG